MEDRRNTNNSNSSDNISDDKFSNDDLVTSIIIQSEENNNYPNILTQSMMLQIAQTALPTSVAFAQWKRLYSLVRDGDSFSTMLRMVSKYKQTLLVVKATDDSVFGAYADSPWESQHKHSIGHAFYGSAQAFLFSIDNDNDNDESNNANNINIYKWTGKNRYIQFCDVTNKLLAMGGGGKEGSFGLCVEDDFRRGSTGRCETFDNECLVGNNEDKQHDARFNILDLEIWGFVTGF